MSGRSRQASDRRDSGSRWWTVTPPSVTRNRHSIPKEPVLAEELLDLKEARSLTALRSLDKFLSSRMELLTSDVVALAPPQRAAHMIGYAKSTKGSRPFGGSSSSKSYSRRLARAGSPRHKSAIFSRLAMRSPLKLKPS